MLLICMASASGIPVITAAKNVGLVASGIPVQNVCNGSMVRLVQTQLHVELITQF